MQKRHECKFTATAKFIEIAASLDFQVEKDDEMEKELGISIAFKIEPQFPYCPHFQDPELSKLRSPSTFLPVTVLERFSTTVENSLLPQPPQKLICAIMDDETEISILLRNVEKNCRSFIFVKKKLDVETSAITQIAGIEIQSGITTRAAIDSIARIAAAVVKSRSRPVPSAFRSRGNRKAVGCETDVQRFWVDGLLQVPGLEREAANAVSAHWKSPFELNEFIAQVGKINAIIKISEIPVVRITGTRKLGKGMAKRLVAIYSFDADPWVTLRRS